MKKEEANFTIEQFEETIIPGKKARWIRHCILFQFIRMSFFGLRSIGIILLNIRNEKEIPQ
ncbi:MAG: hypothetical protein DRQ78_03020 [Epsilonproteobacteria bacterium]|nr:MAG: hypothetical protein DRQ78_03020 [Campylobacterota bacterium]